MFENGQRIADIPWGSYYNGQNPQIWATGSGTNQQWYRHSPYNEKNGDGVWKGEWQQIKTKSGGNYCLDVKGGRAAAGAEIQIYLCGGYQNNNQKFQFI